MTADKEAEGTWQIEPAGRRSRGMSNLDMNQPIGGTDLHGRVIGSPSPADKEAEGTWQIEPTNRVSHEAGCFGGPTLWRATYYEQGAASRIFTAQLREDLEWLVELHNEVNALKPRVQRYEKALREAGSLVSFLVSCIASGENLHQDDLDRLNAWREQLEALRTDAQPVQGEA